MTPYSDAERLQVLKGRTAWQDDWDLATSAKYALLFETFKISRKTAAQTTQRPKHFGSYW
ncbi:MAG: hypothetical protein R3B45_05265 [Bdellovibrionota bacterium]